MEDGEHHNVGRILQLVEGGSRALVEATSTGGAPEAPMVQRDVLYSDSADAHAPELARHYLESSALEPCPCTAGGALLVDCSRATGRAIRLGRGDSPLRALPRDHARVARLAWAGRSRAVVGARRRENAGRNAEARPGKPSRRRSTCTPTVRQSVDATLPAIAGDGWVEDVRLRSPDEFAR